MKILLADDSALVRHNLEKLLCQSLADLEILTSDSVASTIREIEDHAPDIVILDLKLLDGSGFEVLQYLQNRDSAEASAPSVIVLTSFGGTAERERSFALGASHFLDKNADYERLIELLN